MVGIHGASGKGKSTAEVDLALYAWEQGWADGVATNLDLNPEVVAGPRPFAYKKLRYLTELSDIRGMALGLDELNRALDGRSWQDELRTRISNIVDMSRRRKCRLVVATSIRETGVDVGLRRSITCVISPTGRKTDDGYPIYNVFADYYQYSRFLYEPLKAEYYEARGFHTVEYLKTVFNSLVEPQLDGYPPIVVRDEAASFKEWGTEFFYNNEGRLVSLPKLWLHIKRWNADAHEIPFRERDLEKILSFLYASQDGGSEL